MCEFAGTDRQYPAGKSIFNEEQMATVREHRGAPQSIVHVMGNRNSDSDPQRDRNDSYATSNGSPESANTRSPQLETDSAKEGAHAQIIAKATA
jgi:hypothetical protein